MRVGLLWVHNQLAVAQMVERWTVEDNRFPLVTGSIPVSEKTRVPERSNGRGLRSRASASWVRIPPRVNLIVSIDAIKSTILNNINIYHGTE